MNQLKISFLSVVSFFFISCITMVTIPSDISLNKIIKPKEEKAAINSKSIPLILKNDEKKLSDVSIYRTNRYEAKAQEYAEKYPATSMTNELKLKTMALDLVEEIEDPFMKVKLIHDWIALTIRYDLDSYFKGPIPDQSAYTVLHRETAVCEGYANLFESLCRHIDIPVRKVPGYARGIGSSPEIAEDPSESNHAWNIVKIQDYWYPIDVTWDAGQVSNNRWNRNYTTSYFLLRPEWMIYTHFPEQAYMQFLENPISGEDFVKLPFLSGLFFDTVLAGYAQLQKNLEIINEEKIILTINPIYTISAALFDIKTRKKHDYVFIERENDEKTIHIAPPKGDYILHLYSGCTEKLTSMAEFYVKSTMSKGIPAPMVYSDYEKRKARLLEPVMRLLVPDTEQQFLISVPNAQKVILIINGKNYEMDKKADNLFEKILRIPKTKKIDIFASFEKETQYTGLISIPVQ